MFCLVSFGMESWPERKSLFRISSIENSNHWLSILATILSTSVRSWADFEVIRALISVVLMLILETQS